MSETLLIFWEILWSTPLYRGLIILIAAELVVVGALIAWMIFQSARQMRQGRAKRLFMEALEDDFFEALGEPTPERLRGWMERAAKFEPSLVQDFLASVLLHTRGAAYDALIVLYHEFGYAEQDRAASRSKNALKRLRALRRLYVLGSAEDRPVLLEQAGAEYLAQVLAMQTLARVGQPEDIVALLQVTRLYSQMMEEPVQAVLSKLPPESLRYVFARWQQFECGRVRRLLLTVAAEQRLEGVSELLAPAARSEDMEVRIGACQAAGSLQGRPSFDLLLSALDDPTWQVRARAARALGRRQEPAAAAPLAQALKDRAFWVRQDAAGALGMLGAPGAEQLHHVAAYCDDRYAAESATQELQRSQRLLERAV
ncbi:HEAT repeat domain-containing protein [Bradymonas sediminis]|uniref:Uncharacterized protein n=1 Tax=Bradymonas sediminis TaxID=1548548 RepID=A0A2Z4FH71_9DELT|nr:HEAT repeat domain-containing protein [Bradymonas sediminis]AWV88352.1 hypothetical protein DN745_02935 [Bradymonas sediminis]TDP77478.1 HEAT repeat protein [Bradymonas sediminis]